MASVSTYLVYAFGTCSRSTGYHTIQGYTWAHQIGTSEFGRSLEEPHHIKLNSSYQTKHFPKLYIIKKANPLADKLAKLGLTNLHVWMKNVLHHLQPAVQHDFK